MTTDTWVSLAILFGCVLAGWLFFRWDSRVILRDRQALECADRPLVGYEILAGRPNSQTSGLQGSRRPLPDDNLLGGGATTLRDRIADVIEDTICGYWEDGYGPTVASAVIAALNLTISVDYLSADRQRRNFMVAGHYTVEVTDE